MSSVSLAALRAVAGPAANTPLMGMRLLGASSLGNSTGSSAFGGYGSAQRRAYHESVIDHFNKPRNIGKLDAKKSSVGTALVGKASCGDVIKMQINVEDGKITDAKFKTFGCGSAIASSSLATEMIIGREVKTAEEIKNTDISEALSLPPVKLHCSVLAEEAIQAAIKDWRKKQDGAAKE